MTISARSTSLLPARRPALSHLHVLLAAVAACLLTVLVFAAPPAHAVVTEVAGANVGLQPRDPNLTQAQFTQAPAGEVSLNPAETFDNASGNPVLHSTDTYAIYWDPTDSYHGDWQHLIDTFFHDLGAGSGSLSDVFSVDTQYTDNTNVPATYDSTFRGAYTDTHGYPSPGCTDPHALQPGDAITCITDAQLRTELEGFISEHNLKTGMGTIYYLMTPPGVTVCVDALATHCSDYSRSKAEETERKFESQSFKDSFCSYHSAINSGNLATGDANTILYAAMPWIAGGLGDPHLAPKDRKPAYDCQDGGWNPSSTPPERYEGLKQKTVAEEEAFAELSPSEKQAAVEAEEAEGPPNQQEPNQPSCPSSDGGCDTGLADLIINQVAVEQQNIVTNPLLNAWQDSAQKELTDECRNFFAPKLGGDVGVNPNSHAGTLFNQEIDGGDFYLNNAFNLAALLLPYPGVPCLHGVSLDPKFTAPNTVKAGDVAGFDGMESNISLNAAVGFSGAGSPQANYATYTWEFGDGSPAVSGYAPGAPACETPWLSPCAASVFHSYQYGGVYRVTLSVRDVGGHTATYAQTVDVVGPGPSANGPGSTSGANSTSSSSTTSSTPGASATQAPVPAPVAAAAVVSRSLKSVLRKGLVVRYSVNEQVAGHFEVLLAKTIARRLGISGETALGMAAGTPPQVIVARAVLVTTQAGRSNVVIQFSKRTAARLKRLHKVTLTLRLIVRNAASHTPTSTTVLSPVTLAG